MKAWRQKGYPGVTGTTLRLLRDWQDPEERTERRFFFCQLGAIETLIWLTEAPDADKVGIIVPSDGGPFPRWCNKMATGTGQDHHHGHAHCLAGFEQIGQPSGYPFFKAKNILAVAPGLTVKSRLAVLLFDATANPRDSFPFLAIHYPDFFLVNDRDCLTDDPKRFSVHRVTQIKLFHIIVM